MDKFLVDGLAVYQEGIGQSVLLMPYPHASGYKSMIESNLVSILSNLGFCVITFDPPGIFDSTRLTNVDLKEIFDCTNEVLDFFKIKEPISIVGHSQSAFCSIAFAIEFPHKVKNLLLIGAVSSWKLVFKSSIHKKLCFLTKDFWLLMYFGIRKFLNLSNLYIHKKLDQIVFDHSFFNKSLVFKIEIDKKDKKKNEPIRAKWMVNMRKHNYDYDKQLQKIIFPTLICCGKYDTQTPVEISQFLSKKIKNSQLKIFENSGHSPFIEEIEKFIEIISNWYNKL